MSLKITLKANCFETDIDTDVSTYKGLKAFSLLRKFSPTTAGPCNSLDEGCRCPLSNSKGKQSYNHNKEQKNETPTEFITAHVLKIRTAISREINSLPSQSTHCSRPMNSLS